MAFPGIDWTFDAAEPLALAEAVGHAWVQQRAGGSVTLVDPCLDHPWWPVLRGWLPADAPLAMGRGEIQAFPERPFPPIHLAGLPRSGEAEVDLEALARSEPFLLLADAPAHPALAVALAAIAGWGWRVCWRTEIGAGWDEALAHIGRRQLPLHLTPPSPPPALPLGWMVVPRARIGLWLQHEWPTVYVP